MMGRRGRTRRGQTSWSARGTRFTTPPTATRIDRDPEELSAIDRPSLPQLSDSRFARPLGPPRVTDRPTATSTSRSPLGCADETREHHSKINVTVTDLTVTLARMSRWHSLGVDHHSSSTVGRAGRFAVKIDPPSKKGRQTAGRERKALARSVGRLTRFSALALSSDRNA
jgi:hypothetical protein